MMHVLFSTDIPEELQQELINNYSSVTFTFANDDKQVEKEISTAEVFVTFGSRLNEDLLQKAHQLKWIMVLSAGVDRLPFNKIKEKNIIVTNTRGIHKTQMAEYAISMLLQVYRDEKKIFQQEMNKEWNKSLNIQEITGKTILVAGTGAIGQEVARLAKAFRMATIGLSRRGLPAEHFDETIQKQDLDQYLPTADFLVSVLPSTSETKGFFTLEHLQKLPKHALFLNMGRGDVISEEDLLLAIKQEEIAHIILDVFPEEPLPREHPFWEEDKITITPHISGRSPHYMQRAMEIFRQNLSMYIDQGKPTINQIDLNERY